MPEAAPSAPQPAGWTDPYRNYNFKLNVMGVTEGHFVECSSIGVTVEAIRYREGGLQQVVHRLPGRVEYGDVTLRYGLTKSDQLWRWFQTAVEGRVERKNISIILMDADGVTEATRWDLLNAWPTAWRGAPLDALGNEVAIESLTLVCESVQRA